MEATPMTISKGISTVTSWFFTQNQIERADDVYRELSAGGVDVTFEVYMPNNEWLGYVVRFTRSLVADRIAATL
jgi:hypothetical protein